MGRRAEIMLAAAVLTAIAVMLIPLPTWLLDLLLTFNLAISATLLLTSLTIPSIRALSTLPSLLLLTTLLRLALNVSTTRLILLDANAGQVIEAFGGFVVRGSVIVGAVVFLILTLIQFLVIARGAERVAEVAARFSLDAMPGRQMAIDADLRAGALSAKEAAAARRSLQRESQIYGSMDGALKFVKGDAIAGIAITAINIVGGLAIGVVDKGMDLSQAASTYALLTIGDGLVSQLPALLTATAAGLAVTRVTGDGQALGTEAARQLLARPDALAIAAALCVVLAVVPGLPLVPFLTLGLLIGALSWWARQQPAATAAASAITTENSSLAQAPPQALELKAGPQSHRRLQEEGLQDTWKAHRQGLLEETGVLPPELILRLDPNAAPEEARLWLHGVPTHHWEPQPEANPSATQIAQDTERLLRGRLDSLLGLQEVQDALDQLRSTAPADVDAVVPKLLTLAELTQVLRGLLDEGVSVRHLRAILMALATQAPTDKTPAALIEAARAGLRHVITHQLCGQERSIKLYMLDREVEETIRDAVRRDGQRLYLSLPPALRQQILQAAAATLPEENAVVMTPPDIRAITRHLLSDIRPQVTVVSHNELEPSLHIDPQGTIDVRQR